MGNSDDGGREWRLSAQVRTGQCEAISETVNGFHLLSHFTSIGRWSRDGWRRCLVCAPVLVASIPARTGGFRCTRLAAGARCPGAGVNREQQRTSRAALGERSKNSGVQGG